MSKLTMRSKIRVYWTTNPADMGYDGRPTNGRKDGWKGPRATYELCSMRKAAGFSYELGQRVGQGTYRAVSYWHDGAEIPLSDIISVIENDDYQRCNR